MAKTTIDALEKVIKKFLQPIEQKIECVLSELKKIDEKICRLEGNKNVTESSSNGGPDDQPKESKPKAAQLRSNAAKNPVAPRAVVRLDRTTTTEQPVPVASARRGSLPTTAATVVAGTAQAPAHRPGARPHAAQRASLSETSTSKVSKVTYATVPTAAHKVVQSQHERDSEQVSLDGELPWQVVATRKNRQRNKRQVQRVVVTGTGSVDNEIETVERVRKIHACLFKPDTSAESIKSFMQRKNPNSDYMVDKLELKHNFYSSFLLTVPSSTFKFFMTPENWPPRVQVSSPFYLSLTEGMSDVSIHSGDSFGMYLPLLHIPSKPAAGYHGIAEVLKLTENSGNVYVDLLVVVKAVHPAKTIRTKLGTDMAVRSVEIMDNTTPAPLTLDMFEIDTIQRAEEWRPLESVLFIADARVSWRGRPVKVQACAKTVITHQPHTADAEALRLYTRNQANTRGGEAAAWAAWSGERACAASVAQVRDRLAAGAPFCAALHALMTHLDLEDLVNTNDSNVEDLRVRFADHTGELTARLPVNILEDTLGHSANQLKAMTPENRSALRWRILLEQCSVKLAGSPSRLLVLSLRKASPADPIPLY